MKITQNQKQIFYLKTIILIVALGFLIPACDNQENEPVNDSVQIDKILKSDSAIILKLISSYPDFIDSVSNNKVYFKDKSTLPFDNSLEKLNFDDTLNYASIKDQFYQVYSIGPNYQIPIATNFDPGRIRNDDFFKKIYGNTKIEVEHNLTTVQWLPKKLGEKVSFSKINNAAKQLQKVSNELDMLPDSLLKYLESIGGTFIWKEIAGTSRLSAHSMGIAIDINNHNSNYWRNTKPNSKGMYAYRNRIPWEIVSIFEKYGFIWGGKWYHYDTMHFEYRPELIKPRF
ncbi:MAG: M15 family metallopeptidase [bacterium]